MPLLTVNVESLKKIVKNRHPTLSWLHKGEIALPLTAVISVSIFGYDFRGKDHIVHLGDSSVSFISLYTPESKTYFP